MKPALILFDVGGTLLRTAHPVGETYASLARHYGQEWDADVLQVGFRRAWRQCQPRLEGSIPSDGNDQAWWRRVVEEAVRECPRHKEFPFDAYFSELYGLFARPELWRVFPEVHEVLSELFGRGIPLGILSNWDSRLNILLEELELADYFTRRWISAELGVAKPQRQIYERVKEDAGLDPGHILLVGDDEENDGAVPAAMGWQTAIVRRPECDLRVVLQLVNGL
jgi:putative hydrolase of the HAD superfamily